MTSKQLKEAADKFKENFMQVIVESKRTGYLVAGILDRNDQLTTFDSTEFNTYSTSYTKDELKECFIIHDYNNWSV